MALAIAIAGQADAGVPGESLGRSHGLHYVVGESSVDGQDPIEFTTFCQPITLAIGGGVDMTGSPRMSRASISELTKGGWEGRSLNLSDAMRQLRVFAICPLDKPEVESVEFGGVLLDQGESGVAEATCAEGSFPVAGGVRLQHGIVTRSEPFDDSDPGKSPDGWRVRGQNTEAFTNELQVIVVCLDIPRRQIRYVKNSAMVKRDRAGTVRASCPKSMAAMNGGFSVGGGADSFLHSLVPADSKADRKRVPDDRFAATVVNDGNSQVRATATVICRR
jgi:hypothetical protein